MYKCQRGRWKVFLNAGAGPDRRLAHPRRRAFHVAQMDSGLPAAGLHRGNVRSRHSTEGQNLLPQYRRLAGHPELCRRPWLWPSVCRCATLQPRPKLGANRHSRLWNQIHGRRRSVERNFRGRRPLARDRKEALVTISHFGAVLLFSLFTSIVFGITQRAEPRMMIRFGAFCFVLFVGGTIVGSWVMWLIKH